MTWRARLASGAERVDWRVFAAINSRAGRWPALDRLMVALADYGPMMVGLPLIGLWFAGRGRDLGQHRKMVLRAGVGLVLGRSAKIAINRLVPRPRPYERHDVHLLVKPTTKPSFPSNHAAESWIMAWAVHDGPRPLAAILLPLALLVGVSRVFVGKHYPSDVVGGALLAIAVDSLLGRIPPLRTRAARDAAPAE